MASLLQLLSFPSNRGVTAGAHSAEILTMSPLLGALFSLADPDHHFCSVAARLLRICSSVGTETASKSFSGPTAMCRCTADFGD